MMGELVGRPGHRADGGHQPSMESTRWRSWLSHCATSRKVAGSIPNDVNGIFL